MIRQRLSSWRVAKILGLTAALLTWSAALLARLVGLPVADAATPQGGAVEDDATTVASTNATATAPLPSLPEDGLILIRTARTAEPEPIVRRVVVQQPSSQAAATQAPQRRTQSSGS